MSLAIQPDLFAPPRAARAAPSVESEHAGWERRLLSDMAELGSITACYPGFTGAISERLVAKGLARCEPAGFMGPCIDLDGNPVLYRPATKHTPAYRYVPEHPQFRYRLTDAGVALSSQGLVALDIEEGK